MSVPTRATVRRRKWLLVPVIAVALVIAYTLAGFLLAPRIAERELPRFVEDRFSLREQSPIQKEKLKKEKSPWWNLAQVASKAKGNEIGSITDLQTSCIAAGHPELAF